MISLIAAMSKNYVIGKNGVIPWNIKGEQKRFKELTTAKTIIMGRKTFDEIGRPLPNRNTILVSSSKTIVSENCITVKSIKDALELTKNEDEVFIAGGGQVYKDTIAMSKKLYITVIDIFLDGDVYFPNFESLNFTKTYEEKIYGEIPFTYYTFEKNQI